MGVDYSKYFPEIKKLPPNVCVIYNTPYIFYGINLPPEVVQEIGEIFRGIWRKEIKIKIFCETIMKFDMRESFGIFTRNSDTAKLKLMYCKFHKAFYKYGWSLINSPTLTFTISLSSWFYFKYDNPFLIHDKKVENEFCAIGLSRSDGLQFFDFPVELESSVINCVRQNWKKGAKDKHLLKDSGNVWSLQLNGFPWACYGKQSLDARFLVLCLIRFMSHHNWRLVNSTAMEQDASDTMFFRSQSNTFNGDCPESMPEYYFMLALMNQDSFSILGADTSLGQFIANSCNKYETKGSHPLYIEHNYVSLDLKSYVWSRRNEKETETRRLITCLFQDLASIGWIPTESIDCTRHITDLSSLVFVIVPPVRMQYFCLCPRKYNGICLINAEEDVETLIFNTFVHYYPVERNNIKRSIYGVGSSIDFNGDPFRGSNLYGVLLFQLALAAIISELKEIGWYLLVSADTSNETKRQDEDTVIKWSIYGLWFCRALPS